jgi:hypothetical protein
MAKIVSFILVLGLTSCDPGAFSIITNQSGRRADVEIVFDKDSIKDDIELYGGLRKYLDRHLNYHSSKGEIIKLDTINLVVVIQIKPKDSLLIDGRLARYPNFNNIKKLVINSKVEYKGQEEISDAFKESGGVLYELKIE